ncbi:MBL fold metallo-hydrolase [Flavobacterium paronense]|uniref:MBL fold metallo-hydrolase n=1 Tax=Flavobacterium paronense TaxID=1392775 RepID=A0ABV5GFD6_9FLAO|nr:MBL fold metallo-hydrolase [Flavobacterium paronense]MDN3676035.1 MBL fold metallo-hydrolase [Flavobacterium paronense]
MIEPLFCNLDDRSIVYRSVSDLFGVCTYFLVDQEKVIIVDPGRLSEEVYHWLEQFKAHKKIIYLTHEHFDHHYDVNKLLAFENTAAFSISIDFEQAIKCGRKNLSYYYNTPIESVLSKQTEFNFFEIIVTPGHSKFSVCFMYKNMLFGGDTVIEKENLVLKLPGSNKIDYKESIDKIKNLTSKNTIVLPGHGNLFLFNNWFKISNQ